MSRNPRPKPERGLRTPDELIAENTALRTLVDALRVISRGEFPTTGGSTQQWAQNYACRILAEFAERYDENGNELS